MKNATQIQELVQVYKSNLRKNDLLKEQEYIKRMKARNEQELLNKEIQIEKSAKSGFNDTFFYLKYVSDELINKVINELKNLNFQIKIKDEKLIVSW